MLSVDIICAGKIKSDPLETVFESYRRRLQWKFTLHEIEGRNQAEEHAKLLSKIDPHAALIVLDETGKSLSSRELSEKINQIQISGYSKIQFMLGGADGLSDEIRQRSTLVLSFGRLTWPHLLARAMLMEQIYRAQQILAGHPYHRD